MEVQPYLVEMDQRIKLIEKAAAELAELGKQHGVPAVYKNARRITASVNILKITVSDVIDLKV